MRSFRLLKAALIVGLVSLVAACASVGGAGKGGGRAVPVVKDPAPIVSGTMRPYQVRGHWYRPTDGSGYDEVGTASWYGDQFNGRPTATGERFDMHGLSAAHKTLPLPGLVEVTNLANGRSIVLRVNDRGPFVDDRIIDLSRGAAEALDMMSRGVGQVRVRYIGMAPRGGGTGVRGEPLTYAENKRGGTPVVTARPRATASPVGPFWVQAGSFADPLAAQQTAETLGSKASVDPAEVDGRRLYRVLVGPWGDANAAEQARQSLVGRGVRDALLISSR